MKIQVYASLSVLMAIFPLSSSACPLVDGLLDFNCDERLKIVVTGDSVVAGVGDSENGNRGGYVKRLNQRMSSAKVVNLGTSGITSGQLLRRFTDGFYRRAVRRSDLIVIDVGRNDCRDRLPALAAFRNIKRLVSYLEDNVGQPSSSPFILVSTQIPVLTWRRSCVEQINRILIRRNKRKNFPAYLRFDKLPASVLSSDGLHPDSAGYRRIGNFLFRFINDELQDLMLAARPEIAPTE